MDDRIVEAVPRNEWPLFFDAFSRQHLGWPVTVEVLGAEPSVQFEARRLSLQGIAYDKGEDGSLSIMLGGDPSGHLTHAIQKPRRVWLGRAQGDDSRESIVVESEDGSRTVVTTEAQFLREIVDAPT
jgi:hypothetical protein